MCYTQSIDTTLLVAFDEISVSQAASIVPTQEAYYAPKLVIIYPDAK